MTAEERKAAKKALNIDAIRAECKADEVKKAWYNEFVTTDVPRAKFPKGADGKPDKTQQPTVEMVKPGFIELQAAFIAKFHPELLATKAAKKEDMYTLL